MKTKDIKKISLDEAYGKTPSSGNLNLDQLELIVEQVAETLQKSDHVPSRHNWRVVMNGNQIAYKFAGSISLPKLLAVGAILCLFLFLVTKEESFEQLSLLLSFLQR